MAEQTITIQIQTRDGVERMPVTPIENTPFAYGLAIYAGPTYGPDWSVTHVPTEKCLPFSFSCAEHCERYVKVLLLHTEYDWGRKAYTKPMIKLARSLFNGIAYMSADEEMQASTLKSEVRDV